MIVKLNLLTSSLCYKKWQSFIHIRVNYNIHFQDSDVSQQELTDI